MFSCGHQGRGPRARTRSLLRRQRPDRLGARGADGAGVADRARRKTGTAVAGRRLWADSVVPVGARGTGHRLAGAAVALEQLARPRAHPRRAHRAVRGLRGGARLDPHRGCLVSPSGRGQVGSRRPARRLDSRRAALWSPDRRVHHRRITPAPDRDRGTAARRGRRGEARRAPPTAQSALPVQRAQPHRRASAKP